MRNCHLPGDDSGTVARDHVRMPMLRCPRCAVRQYAATPYVAPVECVACGFRLVAPRHTWSIERERERARVLADGERRT
jgi:hypothetical protein